MRRAGAAWIIGAVLLAAYVAAGFAWSSNGAVLTGMSKWVFVADSISPALFIVVYTLIGFSHSGRAGRWWKNDIGVTLVWAKAAIIAESAVLAWTFLFHGGQLTGPLAAWIFLGGPIAASLIILWRTFIFVRIWREGRSRPDPGGTCPACGRAGAGQLRLRQSASSRPGPVPHALRHPRAEVACVDVGPLPPGELVAVALDHRDDLPRQGQLHLPDRGEQRDLAGCVADRRAVRR